MNYVLYSIVVLSYALFTSAAEPSTDQSIVIITSDNQKTTITSEDAKYFKTINDMLEFSGDEPVNLYQIDKPSLDILVNMAKPLSASNRTNAVSLLNRSDIKQLVDVLNAANFLDAEPRILDIISSTIASILIDPKTKNSEAIQSLFSYEVELLVIEKILDAIREKLTFPALRFKTYQKARMLATGKHSNRICFGLRGEGVHFFWGSHLKENISFDLFEETALALCFINNDKDIAVGTSTNSVTFYRRKTHHGYKKIRTDDLVSWLDTDPLGTFLAYMTKDGKLHLHNMVSDRNIATIPVDKDTKRCARARLAPLIAAPSKETTTSLSAKSGKLSQTEQDIYSIRIIDGTTGEQKKSIMTQKLMNQLYFCHNDSRIFGVNGNTLYLYELDSGNLMNTLSLPSPIISIAIDPDESSLVVASAHNAYLLSMERLIKLEDATIVIDPNESTLVVTSAHNTDSFSMEQVMKVDRIKTYHSIVDLAFTLSAEYLICAINDEVSLGYFNPRPFIKKIERQVSVTLSAALYKALCSEKGVALYALNDYEKKLLKHAPKQVGEFVDRVTRIKRIPLDKLETVKNILKNV